MGTRKYTPDATILCHPLLLLLLLVLLLWWKSEFSHSHPPTDRFTLVFDSISLNTRRQVHDVLLFCRISSSRDSPSIECMCKQWTGKKKRMTMMWLLDQTLCWICCWCIGINRFVGWTLQTTFNRRSNQPASHPPTRALKRGDLDGDPEFRMWCNFTRPPHLISWMDVCSVIYSSRALLPLSLLLWSNWCV